MTPRLLPLAGLLFLLSGVLTGCPHSGTGPTGAGSGNGSPTKNGKNGAAIPVTTPSIRGRVEFVGDAPPRHRIAGILEDDYCSENCKDPRSERLIVDRHVDYKTVRNAIISIKRADSPIENESYPVPEKTVVLDQTGCVFRPHIVSLRVGQTLTIRNSDKIKHNANLRAEINDPRNEDFRPIPGYSIDYSAHSAEIIPVLCNSHPWMQAYAAFFDHPFYAVTGADGTFELPGPLPPGTYTVTAWHEWPTLYPLEKQVTVGDGETTVNFTFVLYRDE